MEKASYGLGVFLTPWLSVCESWLKTFSDRENAMRRFIRHPSDIPLVYSLGAQASFVDRLKDVSKGGLCFIADTPLQAGSSIHLEIGLQNFPFAADGTIAWCRPEQDAYSVGVAFRDNSTQFSVRMVEQICHIEHYRAETLSTEGRALSSDEAAQEWVEKYAATFPQS